MVKIAPSILSANFSILGEEIKSITKAGADLIHVDVMDGHFVPSITIGPLVVESIRPITKLPLDVHLMVEQPDKHIENFIKSGADIISIHAEVTQHLHRTIYLIKNSGVKVAVALNPATPLNVLDYILKDLDMVLLMTVNPGYAGQTFIPNVLSKIKELRQTINYSGLKIDIQVDGGINNHTYKKVVEAGANILVAGSYVFGSENRETAIKELKKNS
ncbi:MAG: ribulose-phosphate 3-epimerase [Vulcanibacillus sp.]